MEKRSKLLILIAVALALLIFGIWYLLQPILGNFDQGTDTPNNKPATNLPNRPNSPDQVTETVSQEKLDLKKMEDLAGVFVARIGSGASGDGFRGYEDVLINATKELQQKLKLEQQALQQAHPSSGPVYSIVTRVVAIDSKKAVASADLIPFTVQVQQAEYGTDPNKAIRVRYKEATVTFQKQSDGNYLVNGVVWKDIEI